MAVPAAPPAPIGMGKSIAAVAAGALSTIVIYVVDQVMQHYQMPPLPAGIEAAVQTLITTLAVFATPHTLGS